MNATMSRMTTLGVCALVALTVGSSVAAARSNARDEVYRDARLDQVRPATVAILPVVAMASDTIAERLVEAGWFGLYRESATRWTSADEVRTHFQESGAEPGNIARLVAAQIWRDGSVASELAGRLTRLLGVDAVLSVRIDRWEVVDGGRALVAMSAVLTGADGARLWSISGMAGHGTPAGSVERSFAFEPDVITVRNPESELSEDGHRLSHALFSLMARWAWALPAPIDERADVAPVLAEYRPR